MKSIVIYFKSNEKLIKKVAILNDGLDTLSKNKKNEASDIVDYPEDNFWSLLFDDVENESFSYEIEFECSDDGTKTLKPKNAITWYNEGSGAISDAQTPIIVIK